MLPAASPSVHKRSDRDGSRRVHPIGNNDRVISTPSRQSVPGFTLNPTTTHTAEARIATRLDGIADTPARGGDMLTFDEFGGGAKSF